VTNAISENRNTGDKCNDSDQRIKQMLQTETPCNVLPENLGIVYAIRPVNLTAQKSVKYI